MASKMCRYEGLDISAAITDSAANSDEWTTTSISAFAVKRPQAATQKFCCFS
jgi:hypothetical protein